MEEDNIIVMMSTYNGEKYIKEQIESIFSQKGVNIKLIVRDDGSNDLTRNIVEGFEDERIELISGENLGWKESFNELVRYAGTCEFYAFSDQDDVWIPEKLKTGIAFIKGQTIPCLYYCDAMIADENLNIIGIKKIMHLFLRKRLIW